jgi:hypothetical protein
MPIPDSLQCWPIKFSFSRPKSTRTCSSDPTGRFWFIVKGGTDIDCASLVEPAEEDAPPLRGGAMD